MNKRDAMKYEYPYNVFKYVDISDEYIEKAKTDKDVMTRYEEVLNTCTERSVRILKWCFLERRSCADIAQELNISVTTATSAMNKAAYMISRNKNYVFEGEGEPTEVWRKRIWEEEEKREKEEERQIRERDFTLETTLDLLEKAFFPFNNNNIRWQLGKKEEKIGSGTYTYYYDLSVKRTLHTDPKAIEKVTSRADTCKLGVILEYCKFELSDEWKEYLANNEEMCSRWRRKVSQKICKNPFTSMSVSASKVYCLISRKDGNGFAVEKLALTDIDKTSSEYEKFYITLEGKEVNGCFIGNCNLYINDFNKEQDYGKYLVTYYRTQKDLFNAIKKTMS